MRLPNVSSQLYSFSCTQLKSCCLVLCSVFKMIFPFAFCHVKTTVGSPCCLYQATTVQHFSFQSHESPAICTLWETAEKTRRRSFALIVVVKRGGKFIITEKSILYSKNSGKVKSKAPFTRVRTNFCTDEFCSWTACSYGSVQILLQWC